MNIGIVVKGKGAPSDGEWKWQRDVRIGPIKRADCLPSKNRVESWEQRQVCLRAELNEKVKR